MSDRSPLTAQRLWSIPRVGAPDPLPDGTAAIVPVTEHVGDEGKPRTRLWLAPADGMPRALTSADNSSRSPAVSPDGRRLAFVRTPGTNDGVGAGKRKPPAEVEGGDGRKDDAEVWDGRRRQGEGEGGGEDERLASERATERPAAGLAHGAPRHGDVDQLYAMPLDGGEAERLTDMPLGVSGPRWFADGRRIAFLARVYREAPSPEEAAAHKRRLDDDPVKAHVTENRIYRFWDRWLTDGDVHHIFVLDLETRELVDVTPELDTWIGFQAPEGNFAIRPDGAEIAFGAVRTRPPHRRLVSGVFTVPVPPPGAPELVRSPRLISPDDDTTSGSRPVYSPDGKYLVYGMQREHDFYADRVRLVAVDVAGGRHTVLTEDWDGSASGWAFDAAQPDALLFVAETGPRISLMRLDLPRTIQDPAGNPPAAIVEGGHLGAPKPAQGRVWLAHDSLIAPPEAAVIEAGSLRRVTDFTAEALASVRLWEVEDVELEGADRDRVQMFVLHPPDAPRDAALPLVHMIHGGPHGTFGDTWHWRWNSHCFGAPGYRVALVNFHGSTGFGEDYTRSILGAWGDRPARDIEAATDLLIERGQVDPARMAITGGSYGGYLVSWLAGQTDRYACVINHAGVCDFQTQMASDVTQGRARAMGGDLWSDLEGLDRWNPLRRASGFSSPMLVVHGMRDYRVPYAQGLQIYNVYQARGLPSRLVVYPDENHWILKRPNSLHWYGEVLGWLARWLEPEERARARNRP